jgi:DNA polymerase-3 subunit delta'
MIVGHEKQWEFLKNKFEQNQLSHAYLFTGSDGIGKKFFAKEFIKMINCKSEGAPCQKCFSCLAIEKESFPDITLVRPTDKDQIFGDGGEIKIARIREVQNFLSYKSYYGSFKSVIIDNAESMNQEAQSCFLKTLEEPKGQTILFLISSKPDMLLPTIFSRCQTIKFFKPKNLPKNLEKLKKEQEVLNELLPIINANYADKFKYVKSIDWEKQQATEIVEALQKYLRQDIFKNRRALKLTEEISNKLLFTNANPKLALEILLMEI